MDAAPTRSDATAEPVVPVVAIPARRRTLTPGWRWVLAAGWGTVMAGIGILANTGFRTGSPPFWLDWAVIPFLLPVLVLLAALFDWRFILPLSFLAVAGTAAVGVIDLFDARVMGMGELLFAFVGLLVTVSAFAGRVPRAE